jgi:hypothetical protein
LRGSSNFDSYFFIATFFESRFTKHSLIPPIHKANTRFRASSLESASLPIYPSLYSVDIDRLAIDHFPASTADPNEPGYQSASHFQIPKAKMSGALDKSLDEIIGTQRRSAVRGRGNRRVRRSSGKPAVVAPVGGIHKNPKAAKGAVKPVPTGPSSGRGGEGRILVSGFVGVAQICNPFTYLC